VLATIMIDKILKIENVGTFANYIPNNSYGWNGKFDPINIIYASNGSGKTTLSTIFNSLSKNNSDLINLKQSINRSGKPHIELLCSNTKGKVTFIDSKWNTKLSNLKIFDVHFIEDFLFMSSVVSNKNSENLLKLLLGDRAQQHFNRYKRLLTKRSKLVVLINSKKKQRN
jgi:wobble nucleotide-excising tRNase